MAGNRGGIPMRNKLVLISVLVITLGSLYHLLGTPFGWTINESEVKNVYLNDIQVSEEQKSEVVREYNNMKNVRRRNSLEGSTPKYVFKIELNSGVIIDIQDIGTSNFIVDREKGTKYTSFWAESPNVYNIAENISLKK